MNSYIVAGSKPWNRRIFNETISKFPGEWHFLERPEDLTFGHVNKIHPSYLFFLHWSWKVHSEIFSSFECVCFHMTDVPFGRGGSPLQNLIIRGHKCSKLTALKMVESLDAGPVYLKENLVLGGGAEEVYIRATQQAAGMIRRIITERMKPVSQTGEPLVFQRRKPNESRIPNLPDLQSLNDFIRMLDAEGYPKAFLEYEGFRFEFNRSSLYDGRIVADVTICTTK